MISKENYRVILKEVRVKLKGFILDEDENLVIKKKNG